MDGAAPIAVIGGANIDISANTAALLPSRGTRTTWKDFCICWRLARNIAENLARLGSAVQLITGLGDDWFSALVRASLDLPLLIYRPVLTHPIPRRQLSQLA